VTGPETYEELRAALVAEGCFEPRPVRSVLSFVAHLALSGALFFAAARSLHGALAVAAFVAGSFLFYRIGWIMHDAAHGGVFASPLANRRFAALTAGVLGEFPSGWRYGHNRHHAATNVRGRDGDQAERWDPERRYRTLAGAFVGLLIFSKVRGRYLPKSLLLLCLRDGWFCWRHHRASFPMELAAVLLSLGAQIGGLTWLFGAVGPLLFLAHTTVGMVYLNTAFTGNHYDLPSFDVAEAETMAFADMQIISSRNYAGGVASRFLYGGLESHIEHHLFPAMPRCHLRRASPLVRAFCEARGLPYRVAPFSRAVLAALRYHVDPRPR
jgi:fatty acid desaturase